MSGYKLLGKKKGGIFYLSDILTFISSLFGTLTMLFIAALVMFIMHINVFVYVNGVLLYGAPNADNMMMAYLETTNGGYRMRDLLTTAVYVDNTTFNVNGKEADLVKASGIIMNQLTDKPYQLTLDTGGGKTELARVGTKGENAVTTYYIVQAGENRGVLTLWSG